MGRVHTQRVNKLKEASNQMSQDPRDARENKILQTRREGARDSR
jgi:hypothetical protein